MTNQEIIKAFRESGEASFMVFLEENIVWEEPEQLFEEGSIVWLRDE